MFLLGIVLVFPFVIQGKSYFSTALLSRAPFYKRHSLQFISASGIEKNRSDSFVVFVTYNLGELKHFYQWDKYVLR